MVRPGLTGLCLGLVGLGSAQTPDVRLQFDLRPTYRSEGTGGAPYLRLYDPLGRYSTLGVSLLTEPGFRVSIVQRLSRIGGENDGSGLDEAFIEDEGLWRVGKQYLPFGATRLIRESVLAARGDTDLFIEGLPIAAALVDGGDGQPRGAVVRIGSRIGFSVAYGRRFGAAATSLTAVRRPEESPGRGRGYRLMFGADVARRIAKLRLFAEVVAMRDGETPLDPDRVVYEIGGDIGIARRATVGFSFARDSAAGVSFFRLSAEIPVERRAVVEPFIRFDGGGVRDLAVTLRLRF